jgi:hypothetical protein
MTVVDQFQKIKENWLLILICLVLAIVLFGGNILSGTINTFSMSRSMYAADYDSSYSSLGGGFAEEKAMYAPSAAYYGGTSDFAPEITERKITKSASMSTEVEKGNFQDAAATLKGIVTSSSSFLLSENVYAQESGNKKYYTGSYQLKIPTSSYDSAIAQLKQIGTVKQFSESAQDITGTFSNLQIELDAEKARLARYEALYTEAKDVDDKINLNDRIYSEQRTIKYLEDRLKNADQRIDYSTVSVSITEKRSEYVNIALVKLSELVKRLVGSFNALISLLFIILPWAVAVAIVWIVVKLARKSPKRK